MWEGGKEGNKGRGKKRKREKRGEKLRLVTLGIMQQQQHNDFGISVFPPFPIFFFALLPLFCSPFLHSSRLGQIYGFFY